MDEGLLFALAVPTVILLSIVISFLILYTILGNKKLGIIGSIIGFICVIMFGYVLQTFQYVMQIIGISNPFIILILSIIMTAFIGLIIIKIFRRRAI